jgi:hypothetical protein
MPSFVLLGDLINNIGHLLVPSSVVLKVWERNESLKLDIFHYDVLGVLTLVVTLSFLLLLHWFCTHFWDLQTEVKGSFVHKDEYCVDQVLVLTQRVLAESVLHVAVELVCIEVFGVCSNDTVRGANYFQCVLVELANVRERNELEATTDVIVLL